MKIKYPTLIEELLLIAYLLYTNTIVLENQIPLSITVVIVVALGLAVLISAAVYSLIFKTSYGDRLKWFKRSMDVIANILIFTGTYQILNTLLMENLEPRLMAMAIIVSALGHVVIREILKWMVNFVSTCFNKPFREVFFDSDEEID